MSELQNQFSLIREVNNRLRGGASKNKIPINDLIVEVAASSAPIDLRDKRRACCRNGVREYLVRRVADARQERFRLKD